MRISLLTYSTKPRGGVVHTLALAEALAELGQDVEVWSLGRGGDTGFFRPVADAVRVRLVPFVDREGEDVGARITRSIDELAEALARDGLSRDVVHAQDCLSANAALRVRRDVLRTVHHIDQFTTAQLVACHERALREPSRHICVSAAVAEELTQGWGIRATVIPNGVASTRFARAASDQPSAVAARSAWRARCGRYVLAVGGIEPRKGTADLVAAMAILRSTMPDVRLVLAGGETLFDYRGYREEVLRQAERLGVDPVLLGTVSEGELPALVAGASAFAFPSTKEGFGLAAMEALAARVPVVLRDLPVLREVFAGAAVFASAGPAEPRAEPCSAQASGFPAALANALARALLSSDSTLVDHGVQLAGRYSWPDAARAHLRVYLEHRGAGSGVN
jgi:glycosyltransferase-like protein